MRFIKTAIAASLLLGASAAIAAYPDRPVKVIVPYGPGGGVDSFTRPIAIHLSEQVGQQFIVENRGGAGGTIGVQVAAKSPADGYTLLAGGVHQPMAESLYPQRGYDMDKDFIPIAITAVVPNVLVVSPKQPFKTAAEVIAYAKANPDKLSYCSSGSGTSQHIIAELFKQATGTKMLHIPHKGTAAAMLTLLSGDCDLMFDGMGTSAQHINSGKLRAVALTTAKRSTFFPTIPTMTEAGGPPMDAGTWYGLWAPANTPKDVVQKLRAEVAKALATPAVQNVWKAQGAELSPIKGEDLQAYVKSEIVRWTKANQDAGIKME
jgi:tripartite-type tricarboxylate transporter receptor subunit TctC